MKLKGWTCSGKETVKEALPRWPSKPRSPKENTRRRTARRGRRRGRTRFAKIIRPNEKTKVNRK